MKFDNLVESILETKERQYDIEIIRGPYTHEDSPNSAYNEDVLYDIIIDGIKMTWNDTRKCYQNVDNTLLDIQGWKRQLGINDENLYDIYDIIDKQIEKAIKVYNIMKQGASKEEAKTISKI
jgi:hypothetical protein